MVKGKYEDFEETVSKIYDEEERELDRGHYDPDGLRLRMAEKRYNLVWRYHVPDDEKEGLMYNYLEALISSGTYLKGRRIDEHSNDMRRAEEKFSKALKLEKALPVAHYRLGHIYYKHEDYTNSLYHFNKSIEVHNAKFRKFNLDVVQKNTAKKFIAYLSVLNLNKYKEIALSHDQYPELNEAFIDFENTLKKSIDNDSPIKCNEQDKPPCRVSIEQYEDYLDKENCLIIDRYRDEHVIAFNSVETKLKPIESEILVDSFLNSKDESNYLPDAIMLHKVNTNRQKIRRLRNNITSGCRIDAESLGLLFHQDGTRQCINFAPKIPVVIFSRPTE